MDQLLQTNQRRQFKRLGLFVGLALLAAALWTIARSGTLASQAWQHLRHARDQRSQEANAPFANANSISNKWNGVGGIGNAGQRQRGRRINGLSDQLKCNVDAQSPSACFDNANKKRGGKFARCWGAQKYNKRNR